MHYYMEDHHFKQMMLKKHIKKLNNVNIHLMIKSMYHIMLKTLSQEY